MRISDWSSDVCSSDLLIRSIRGLRLRRILGLTRLSGFRGGGVLTARRASAPARAARPVIIAVASLMPAVAVGRIVRRRASDRRGQRAEERRVGKECVSPCRYRGSPYHYKKKKQQITIKTYKTTKP